MQDKCPICGMHKKDMFEGEQRKCFDELISEMALKGTTEYLMLHKVTFNGVGYTNEEHIWICPMCSKRIMSNLQ